MFANFLVVSLKFMRCSGFDDVFPEYPSPPKYVFKKMIFWYAECFEVLFHTPERVIQHPEKEGINFSQHTFLN